MPGPDDAWAGIPQLANGNDDEPPFGVIWAFTDPAAPSFGDREWKCIACCTGKKNIHGAECIGKGTVRLPTTRRMTCGYALIPTGFGNGHVSIWCQALKPRTSSQRWHAKDIFPPLVARMTLVPLRVRRWLYHLMKRKNTFGN